MKTWPHAPSKSVTHPGIYIITAGTYHKAPLYRGHERMELLHDLLLETAGEQGWELFSWAVFPNHYHLVGRSPQVENASNLLTGALHRAAGKLLNELDGCKGRQVWQNAWDTRLTFEKSIMARIAYVHRNPCHTAWWRSRWTIPIAPPDGSLSRETAPLSNPFSALRPIR